MFAAAILQAAAPDAAYAAAVEARTQGRLPEAISAFERLSKERPADADVWLNLGLAYSAAGRYAEAERVLANALRLAPGYKDARLAYARAAWFRGDRSAAAERLQPLLAEGTNDSEVLALDAQFRGRPEAAPRWRLDLSYGRSRLTHGAGRWSSVVGGLGYRFEDNSSLAMAVERTRRFGVADTYIEGVFARPLGARTDAYVAVGGTPNADYRPEVAFRIGVSHEAARRNERSLRLGADVTVQHFGVGTVSSVQPYAVARFGSVALTARSINTVDERDKFRAGYSLRGEWAATPAVRLGLGWTDAPESSEGFTVPVKASSATAALDITPNATLRFDFVHEDRPAYDRDEGVMSVTFRF